MAVRFYLDSRFDKQGEAPIRVSISIKGVRFLTSLGCKIAPEKWDALRQQVKRGCYNSLGISWTKINSLLLHIAEHFADYEIQTKGRIKKNEIQDEFLLLLGKKGDTEDNVGFFETWDIFISTNGIKNQWTKSTYQKFTALRKHVFDWNKRISFDTLDETALTNFIAYLRDKQDMKNTTISKQVSFFKWFLRWSINRGYCDKRELLDFSQKLKMARKVVIFLDWKELMKVYEYEVPSNGTSVLLKDSNGRQYSKIVHDAKAIEKVRDIFCFCAFTSLRFSDAINLKHSNIKDNSITLTTIKTADTITIELNKYAQSILKKNSNINDIYALPTITNQRANIYLKELCELCEINTPITTTYYQGSTRHEVTKPKFALMGTHAGRRTFICNALMLGITPQIVMKWTGHSDYKAMKPYIEVTDEAKVNAMKKFDCL